VTGGGITLEQSLRAISEVRDNVIASNTVVDAPENGIYFPFGSFAPSAPSGNSIVGNTVRGSTKDGINVADFTRRTLVDGNTVTGNGGDGLDIASEVYQDFDGPTVTDNVANSNAALGVNADENDVTDGGGNQAAGNGDARQCVGVVCHPHAFLFGGGNPGSSFSAMSANAKRATRFFLYYRATVTSLRAYLDGGGASSGQQVLRGIIYTDSGGRPGQPLGHSFQATVKAGAPAGWVTLALPYRIELNPGYYWLGLHSGNTGQVARFGWKPRDNSRAFNVDNYLDGPASPFGTSPLDNQAIAIHTIGYPRPSG
jgi:parallel beta-helix repeat protein